MRGLRSKTQCIIPFLFHLHWEATCPSHLMRNSKRVSRNWRSKAPDGAPAHSNFELEKKAGSAFTGSAAFPSRFTTSSGTVFWRPRPNCASSLKTIRPRQTEAQRKVGLRFGRRGCGFSIQFSDLSSLGGPADHYLTGIRESAILWSSGEVRTVARLSVHFGMHIKGKPRMSVGEHPGPGG